MIFDHRGLAESLFKELRQAGYDSLGGVTREAYGSGEDRAHAIIRIFAESWGFLTWQDEAGNLHITRGGLEPPYIYLGSHLDSVPQGGNYDGAAGVIAGLICLMEAAKEQTDLPLAVVALRGEESAWFGKPHLGALGLFGQLTAGDLKLCSRRTGRMLVSHMQDHKCDIEAVMGEKSLFPLGTPRAFIELHIEQGPVLESQGDILGVVSAIAGSLRYPKVTAKGEWGHSGTVPMDMRQDALLASAELWLALHADAKKDRALFTVGRCSADSAAHAISKIPGEAEFSLEFRSTNSTTLGHLAVQVRERTKEVTARRGVSFELGEPIHTAPVNMSEELRGVLCKQVAGAHTMVMSSGAGHDASVFAKNGIPTGMLFVRNQNGSHNPHEEMRMVDFMTGVDVLYRTVQQLASEK